MHALQSPSYSTHACALPDAIGSLRTVLLGDCDALQGDVCAQVPAVGDAPFPIVEQQPLRGSLMSEEGPPLQTTTFRNSAHRSIHPDRLCRQLTSPKHPQLKQRTSWMCWAGTCMKTPHTAGPSSGRMRAAQGPLALPVATTT